MQLNSNINTTFTIMFYCTFREYAKGHGAQTLVRINKKYQAIITEYEKHRPTDSPDVQ